jgi:hypothetical protein
MAYSIGQSVSGGTIFYTAVTFALASATQDYLVPLYWGCYKKGIGGTSTVIGSGLTNSILILSGCTGNTMIAADVCIGLTMSGGGWFLPSKDELNEMYLRKDIIGNFQIYDNYWSSSQSTPETAWMQFFKDGTQAEGDKDQLYRVRPIKIIL